MAFPAEKPVLAHSEFRPIGEIERADARFDVVSEFEPAGDQPAAIDELERRVNDGERDIVLLGAKNKSRGTPTAGATATIAKKVSWPMRSRR